jgi:hypothetical protein
MKFVADFPALRLWCNKTYGLRIPNGMGSTINLQKKNKQEWHLYNNSQYYNIWWVVTYLLFLYCIVEPHCIALFIVSIYLQNLWFARYATNWLFTFTTVKTSNFPFCSFLVKIIKNMFPVLDKNRLVIVCSC